MKPTTTELRYLSRRRATYSDGRRIPEGVTRAQNPVARRPWRLGHGGQLSVQLSGGPPSLLGQHAGPPARASENHKSRVHSHRPLRRVRAPTAVGTAPIPARHRYPCEIDCVCVVFDQAMNQAYLAGSGGISDTRRGETGHGSRRPTLFTAVSPNESQCSPTRPVRRIASSSVVAYPTKTRRHAQCANYGYLA